jgi:hypothetical protein
MSDFEQAIRNEKPDELIERIKTSHDVRRVVNWPGRPDIKIEIRLLSLSEARKAKVDNQLEFKKDGIAVEWYNAADYREQEAAHGMWRAFYNVDTGERIFRSAEHLRSFCTPDELKKLCDEYNAFSEECDPSIDELSDESIESLIDTLKKTPDQVQSKVVSLNTAWKLVRTLVARLQA